MNKPWQPSFLQASVEGDATGGTWRPIHYLGSKLRLLGPLRVAFAAVADEGVAVCDLFAGSGTVAASLSSERNVVAVDIQEYSRVLCSAILRPSRLTDDVLERVWNGAFGKPLLDRLDWAAPLIEYEARSLAEAAKGQPERVCDLMEHASLVTMDRMMSPDGARAQAQVLHRLGAPSAPHPGTVMIRHYGGLYFSYHQAAQLDAILVHAHSQPSPLRETLLAAAISTASELVNTVGKQFAQPMQPRDSDGNPKRHLVAKILRDRQLSVEGVFGKWLRRYQDLEPTGRDHHAVRADYAEAIRSLPARVGLVYADPPYTREHYSRFYHVLETMCLPDEPELSTTRIRSEQSRISRGVYRADRHQSPFCIRSQAPGAFASLFAGVRDLRVPLVLSYSPFASAGAVHPRVMTVEQLTDGARRYFPHVQVTSAGKLSHSKLNSTEHHLDAAEEAELIISCW